MIADIPTLITRQSENFSLGIAELKLETNFTKETKRGDIIQPYAELGIDYTFTRPAEEQIYSGFIR